MIFLFKQRCKVVFEKYNIHVLRISLGLIFILFGFVKFYHGLSPAEGLAIRTIDKLTCNCISGNISIKILAAWEVITGIGLLYGRYLKFTIGLLILHLIGTFFPLIFFPNEMWRVAPFVFSLEGQYIVKNIVFISAAIVIGTQDRVRSNVEKSIA